MARKKFKKGEACSAQPQMKKVGNQTRCVCTTNSGRWQFLPTAQCEK